MHVPEDVVRARKGIVTAVEEKLGAEFFSHTVVFARTPIRPDGPLGEGLKYLVGTGTLVQVDANCGRPSYGVLTCGHVLGALARTMEGTHSDRLTLLIPARGTVPDNRAYAAVVPYRTRTPYIEGANNRSSLGPDLAWLPLAPNDAQSLQSTARSRAVFYNLAKGFQIYDTYERYCRARGSVDANEYLSRQIHMVVGWNREIHERSGGLGGGIWMNELVPEDVSTRDGWVYRDYRINDDRWSEQTYGDGTTLPSTWGGVSGGPVWLVWRPEPTKERYEKMLAGVVFYESPRSGLRTRKIRTHHDLSLIRLLHRAGVARTDVMSEADIEKAVRNLPQPERWRE